jgi:transposase
MFGGVQMAEATRRKRYDKQFKLDALRFMQESDHTITDIARDLGIRRELLYKWKREFQDDSQNAFPGKGKLKASDEELWKLRRELERVKEERDVLKKALAFFSKNAP